jgi:hypothetical protein
MSDYGQNLFKNLRNMNELIDAERTITIALYRFNQQIDTAIANRDNTALGEAIRQLSGVGNQLEQYRLLLAIYDQNIDNGRSFSGADLLLPVRA